MSEKHASIFFVDGLIVVMPSNFDRNVGRYLGDPVFLKIGMDSLEIGSVILKIVGAANNDVTDYVGDRFSGQKKALDRLGVNTWAPLEKKMSKVQVTLLEDGVAVRVSRFFRVGKKWRAASDESEKYSVNDFENIGAAVRRMCLKGNSPP